jgi:hypothetical protein
MTRDGIPKWFQDYGVVIHDAIQNRSYMYGTMVDISNSKAAEAYFTGRTGFIVPDLCLLWVLRIAWNR